MYKITDSYLFIQANSVFLPKPRFRGFPRPGKSYNIVRSVIDGVTNTPEDSNDIYLPSSSPNRRRAE